MKILISTYTYFPSLDGVSHVTQYIAEGLAKKNWDITVITTKKKNTKKFEVIRGVKIYRKKFYTKNTFHFGKKNEYLNFIDTFSKKKFIFINVGLQVLFTDWTFKYLDNKKFYSILYLHGIYSASFNKNDFYSFKNLISKIFRNLKWFFYLWLNKRFIQSYNLHIHLHSKDPSINLLKNLGSKHKLILENAVDPIFFKLKKQNHKKFTFISINSFNHRKNQISILKSYINANIKNSLLILIGNDGREYYKLLLKEKKKIQDKSISRNIKIFYNLSRNETIEFLRKSDVFIMASAWEAYPISILECLAMGIPFISTRVGILPYLPGGIIAKNEKKMSHIMTKFFTNKNLIKKLSSEGRNFARKKFNVRDKLDLLDKKLNKII